MERGALAVGGPSSQLEDDIRPLGKARAEHSRVLGSRGGGGAGSETAPRWSGAQSGLDASPPSTGQRHVYPKCSGRTTPDGQ